MKLPYKLQQFWLRKGMWDWTFGAWQNLMFPHIYDKCYDAELVSTYERIEEGECEEWENRFWFWQYLNNFDGDLEEEE